jgi:hypothetical protein
VAQGCGICHGGPTAENIDSGITSYVLLREYKYWQHHDLHRRAFDTLTSELGKTMSRALYNGDELAASRKAACLACHSTDKSPHTPLANKSDVTTGVDSQFSYEYGNNCQGCHGPASAWYIPHVDSKKWRLLSGSEKESKFGLVDLRNPTVRAAQCAKCHVGSASEGKCVTHEMYAAGHPPLPAFELATASRDEPRHWRQPSEIPEIVALAKVDPQAALARYGYRSGEIESARLVAEGAMASLKASVALVHFTAEKMPNPHEPLDFTHFNCAACHHELRLPSSRQNVGFLGVPGRPVPRTWPIWLARIVIDHAMTHANGSANTLSLDFERAYKNYLAAFNARPFGDRAAVEAAARELENACDTVIQAIGRFAYDKTASRDLLARIAARAAKPPASFEYLDADGAYQLSQAFASIYTDLAGEAYVPGDSPTTPPNFAELKKDPLALAPLLAKLQAITPLAVRTKYTNGIATDRKQASSSEAFIQTGLSDRLKTYYSYDIDAFRTIFTEIQAKLAAADAQERASR